MGGEKRKVKAFSAFGAAAMPPHDRSYHDMICARALARGLCYFVVVVAFGGVSGCCCGPFGIICASCDDICMKNNILPQLSMTTNNVSRVL